MPQVFKILTRMMMIAAALVWSSSCSSIDDRPDMAANDGEMQARFSITVPGTPSLSRAAGYLGEGYDAGEEYENYIDIIGQDFAFYFFDYNNNFVAKLDVFSVEADGNFDYSKTYHVSGTVDKSVKNQAVKVVALANWGTGNYPEAPASIKDLEKVAYEFTAESMNLDSEHKIPLYGVTNPQVLQFSPVNGSDTQYADAGLIHMLRAFAKVRVEPHEYTGYYGEALKDSIEYVKLTRHNLRGFCAPAGIDTQDKYVHNDYNADYVSDPNIPVDSETSQPLDFIAKADGSFVAYIPEFMNLDGGGNARSEDQRARLELKFKYNSKICYVDFCDYSSPLRTPFNILRNYLYNYEVALKDVNSFTAVLDVVPYTSIILEPDFGLDRDENGDIIDKNGNKIHYDGNGNQIFKDPQGYIFLIRDGNYQNIIAKCSKDADGKVSVDRNGSILYHRSGSSYDLLTENPNSLILIKNEYNEFSFEEDGTSYTVVDQYGAIGVFAVVVDRSTRRVLYKLNSTGEIMQ